MHIGKTHISMLTFFVLGVFSGNQKCGSVSCSTELLRKWRAGGLKINGSASNVVKIIKKYKITCFLGNKKAPAGASSRSGELLRKWRPQSFNIREKTLNFDKSDEQT